MVRPSSRSVVIPLAAVVFAIATALGRAQTDAPPIRWFLEAMTLEDREADEALARIAERWRDGYAAILIDLARFTRADEEGRSVDVSGVAPPVDPQGLTFTHSYPGAQFRVVGGRRHPTAPIRARLLRFLERQTGQRFGDDLDRWRRWTWSQPYEPHPDYLAFKAEVSRGVDPRMSSFFSPLALEAARLDEVEWSGLGVDDAPPLVEPAHVTAAEARHVRDGHLVAGVSVDGNARAYPASILAWHYAVHDRVGGRDLLIVHCPLAGVLAAYEVGGGGVPAHFGTSGLVYRSSSLLFDHETNSVWSMVAGTPLIGRLAGGDTMLPAVPIAVTTWRDWRAAHPATTVLSQDTGYTFSYAEGALTRRRLAEVGLVFPSADISDDARPEDEVLGIRPREAAGTRPVAIATRRLGRGQVRDLRAGGHRYVVTTSRAGAARIYDAPETRIVRRRGNDCLEDAAGRCWRAGEDALVLEGSPSRQVRRVAAIRAYWLAWNAMYPDAIIAR